MSDLRLIGFEDLDASELEAVKKIIAKRIEKINIKYQLLSIELKQHKHEYKHSARIIHELRADLFFSTGKAISAKAEDANLYKALDKLIDKLLVEVKHKFKK
ncbi:MAG: HPF/RaiA family ribosome-associated protein [Candidatus Pacearchaeota archaeon]